MTAFVDPHNPDVPTNGDVGPLLDAAEGQKYYRIAMAGDCHKCGRRTAGRDGTTRKWYCKVCKGILTAAESARLQMRGGDF